MTWGTHPEFPGSLGTGVDRPAEHAGTALPGARSLRVAVLDAEGVQPGVVGGGAALEAGPVPGGRVARQVGPGDLGEGGEAGEGAVVDVPGVVHELGPQVGLDADDM